MDLSDLSALLGEDVGGAGFADVWVVLPGAGEAGGPLRGAPLLGEARRLADGLGCYVQAVTTSEAAAQAVFELGADRAHIAADPVAYLAAQQPEFVLLSQAQAPQAAWLAERLNAGLVTGVRSPLGVDPESRALLASFPSYGGEYFGDVTVNSPVKVATLDLAYFSQPYADPGRSGEVTLAGDAAVEPRVRDLGPADYTPPAWRPLTKARTIVAVGRGLRDAEGLALARQVADCLQAELGGDRSARDLGWVDEAHEVGVTAEEVAPRVYLALGIRGDTVHNAAITGAAKVIAVHADPTAPLLKLADLAVAAEPKEFARRLLAALTQPS